MISQYFIGCRGRRRMDLQDIEEGRAFWDIGHAPADQSNQRKYMPGYSVWQIHPVMKLTVL
jgi:hypothetical protein